MTTLSWKDIRLDDQTMWPTSTLVELAPPYVDVRGSIQALVSVPMKSASLISSRKGSVRANHYHKTDWHLVYVLSGSFHHHFRRTNSGKQPDCVRVKGGQMVFTPPMEDHATVFLEDTLMLVFSRNPRDQAYYEADLVRTTLVAPNGTVVA